MRHRLILTASMVAFSLVLTSATAQAAPAIPKIDSMVMSATQPANTSSSTIWYDNFDIDRGSSYAEPAPGSIDMRYSTTAFGNSGKSMECYYPTGAGNYGYGIRRLVFGDSPVYANKRVRPGEKFTDVYWRLYVKYPADWNAGTPPSGASKLSRAIVFAASDWSEASILHCWADGLAETLDPATGIDKNNTLVTVGYNDFTHLIWIGSAASTFQIATTSEVGRWVCLECRMKLNSTSSTGTTNDGYAGMWTDGKLTAERYNMNFRGTWDTYGINALFVEAYWNATAPVPEYRYIDNLIISTQPIGPVMVPANPTLFKTPLVGSTCTGWQVIIASDSLGANVVWSSTTLPGANNTLVVSTSTGVFSGTAAGLDSLPAGPMYFTKVRQQDSTGWSAWSYWHQPFYVETLTGSNKPYAPADLAARGVSVSQIDLAWTDLSANESGFTIQRKAGATGTYATLATVAANAMAYSDTTAAAGTTYYYRVAAYNTPGGTSAYSNEANAAVLTFITVTSANGGEVWTNGSTATVTWTSSDGVGNVDIELSTNGVTWTTLAANVANSGSQAVTVPPTYSKCCRIRVKQTSGGNPIDVSDADFTITAPGDVTGNGVIDGGDLNVLLANWGKPGACWADGDCSGNGCVDGGDMNILLANWGACVSTVPTAADDSYSLYMNNVLTVSAPGVLANDSSTEPMTAIRMSNSAHGSVIWNTNGGFTYTPVTGYVGPDSFTYKANNSTGDSSIATVNIAVNAPPAPIVANDSYTASADHALTVAAAGVLANDSDPLGLSLTASKVADPSHGSVTLNSNGGFTYTPSSGYSGPDSFTYRAYNGFTYSIPATVNITVNQPTRILIDCGSAYLSSSTVPNSDGRYWNNFTARSGSPSVITSCTTSTGSLSGITLTRTSSFSAVGTTGPTQVVNGWPVSAVQDNLNRTSTSSYGAMTFSLLDTTGSTTYDLTVFGSASGTAVTNFTVVGATTTSQQVDCGSAQTTRWATFTGLVPDATGQIAVRVSLVSGTVAPLSVMDLAVIHSNVASAGLGAPSGADIPTGSDALAPASGAPDTVMAAAQSTAGLAVKVNFQPAGDNAPQDYLADSGLPFGAKASGYTYGWAGANATAVARGDANSPDARYDTLIDLPSGNSWEIAVPNGTYSVRVVCGDPSAVGVACQVQAETVPVIDASTSANQRWLDNTVTVVVTDGKLTITGAASKICFLEITAQ